MIIDTHCHLYFDCFKDDLSDIISRAHDNGVERMINVAISAETSNEVVQFANQCENIYASVGIHPNEAEAHDMSSIPLLEELARGQHKVVALGEVGLDYYRNNSSPESQHRILKEFIAMGRRLDLPLIIHCRDAHDDLLNVMHQERQKGELPPSVLHCCSGTEDFLAKWIDLGFYASFTCNATFKNADSLRNLIRMMPLDRLMVETDAPFLAPQKMRGKRNEPSFLTELVCLIAEIRSTSVDEIEKITTDNALRFFKFDRGLKE